MKPLLCCLVFSISSLTSSAIDSERLADCIYKAEGGVHAKVPYGILSTKVANATDARRVCLATINHARHDFTGSGDVAFIVFLGRRYCPPSSDAVGFRNWTNNVIKIYFYDTTPSLRP